MQRPAEADLIAFPPAEADHPHLLYLCDFIPSNLRGGTVLVSRLLATYPPERLTVMASQLFNRISPQDGRLPCLHFFFPLVVAHGRWGLGRLKVIFNWLLLPLVVIAALGIVRRRGTEAILSVAHGQFFVAAAILSALTSLPYALIVHDDWTGYIESTVLGPLGPLLFRAAARRAGVIYAVSPQMQQLLRERYSLQSKLQMPARESMRLPPPIAPAAGLKIVYFGTLNAAVDDSIAAVVSAVNSSGHNYTLDLYTMMPGGLGEPYREWASDKVRFHAWVSQAEAPAIFAAADLLLLPFSFRTDQRHLTGRSFPSKAADYLAAARPILVVAPPESTLAIYAQDQGFAEIVSAPDKEQITLALGRIASSATYRARLSAQAEATFALRHNVARQRREFVDDLTALVRGATQIKAPGKTQSQRSWH